jgi:hypothetical protein
MKIIGKGSRNKNCEDTYLLSCTETELANLVGYYYKGDEKCPKLEVGDEINISEMYQQLYSLKFHEQDVKRIEDNLVSMLNGIRMVEPVIKTLE